MSAVLGPATRIDSIGNRFNGGLPINRSAILKVKHGQLFDIYPMYTLSSTG
jgi:hypothetical protein